MFKILINLLQGSPIARLLGFVLRPSLAHAMHPGPAIRIVSYHDVPDGDLPRFERQLEFFKKYFDPCTMEDLDRLLAGTLDTPPKPLLLPTFDDGLRAHFEKVSYLLTKHGFTGLFLVPTEILTIETQATYARLHGIPSRSEYADGRIAMNTDEVIALSKAHGIVCHTHTHSQFGPDVPAEDVEEELDRSMSILTRVMGLDIAGFGWVDGGVDSYSPLAFRHISSRGFRFALTSIPGLNSEDTNRFELRRSPLDAAWPVSQVSFHLSGVMDLVYHSHKQEISHMNPTSQIEPTRHPQQI